MICRPCRGLFPCNFLPGAARFALAPGYSLWPLRGGDHDAGVNWKWFSQQRLARWKVKCCCFALLLAMIHAAKASSSEASLQGSVVDENGVPLDSVEIALTDSEGALHDAHSDPTGRFDIARIPAGVCHIVLSKPGFFRLTDRQIDLKEGINQVSITLNHETERHETVQVSSSTNPIEPGETAHAETLVAREIRDIPAPSTHDIQNVLIALPAVVRDNGGDLHIAGGRVGETRYLLDGFEIGDPVTGGLTSRVNVDTVQQVLVNTGSYEAENARAGAGTLSLNTAVGDDRWRSSLTNFIPGIDVERGVHLGNFYPRFTLSGPLVKGRAWFSDAITLQRTFSLVKELPPGEDTMIHWAGDSLFRAQINLTPTNVLQGNFLYNQSEDSNLGLGAFSPISTTRDVRAHRSFLSLKDEAWTTGILFSIGVAGDFGRSDLSPKGTESYIVRPAEIAGNYYEDLQQNTHRWSLLGSMTAASRHWHGTHDIQVGVNYGETSWAQSAERTSIEIQRNDGTLAQHTTFAGPSSFHLKDADAGVYVQDTWHLTDIFLLQASLREDWNQILHQWLTAPRIAGTFLPLGDQRAKLTASFGVYYQPPRLAVLGPAFDQQRVDVFYDSTGDVPVAGPLYSRFTLPPDHLPAQRFYTTSVEWQQKLRENTIAGVAFVHRDERFGLAFENEQPGQPGGLFVLQDNRRDRYQAIQFSLRRKFGNSAEFSVSYTRSSATTNQALDYSLGSLIFSPQAAGPLAWDAPNRLVSSGWTPIRFWGLFLSYFLEYRTGFPFSVVNEQQQLVGAPNSLRFPNYLSLNFGIEKRFPFLRHEWAVRLAVINLTGNENPNAVVNNIDAPNFLSYAGGQSRALTFRLRLVK